MGLKPSEVLRNLHHDMSKEDGILSKIAAGAKAVWKAICDMAKKIADFVMNLFRSQKSIMEKLLAGINKNMSLPGGSRNIEFNYFNIAPAHYIFGPVSNIHDLVGHSATSTSVDLVKNAIDTANEIIKKVNANPQANEIDVQYAMNDLVENYDNHLIPVTVNGISSIPNGNYKLMLLRKTSVVLVTADLLPKMKKGYKPSADDIKKYSVSSEDIVKKEPIGIAPSSAEKLLEECLSNYATYDKNVKDIKAAVSNMEKLVTNEDKLKTWLTNVILKSFYKTIIVNSSKTLTDHYDIVIAIGKEVLRDLQMTRTSGKA